MKKYKCKNKQIYIPDSIAQFFFRARPFIALNLIMLILTFSQGVWTDLASEGCCRTCRRGRWRRRRRPRCRGPRAPSRGASRNSAGTTRTTRPAPSAPRPTAGDLEYDFYYKKICQINWFLLISDRNGSWRERHSYQQPERTKSDSLLLRDEMR